MFYRDCYQILSLNSRSSTKTVGRQDSQIDFTTEMFFAQGGGRGVTRIGFSNLGNNQLFKKRN